MMGMRWRPGAVTCPKGGAFRATSLNIRPIPHGHSLALDELILDRFITVQIYIGE